MKKILFPTDFSEAADNAFVHALEFAKIVNAEIVLLHTFDIPIYDNQFSVENYNILYDSVQLTQFDKFKDEIPKLRAIAKDRNLEAIKWTHRLVDGNLVYSVQEIIDEEKIDYVVMGTTGASGWEGFFLGTNTGNVLSAVSVPVLSVPVEAKFKKIEAICFTIRYREKDKKELKNILKIAKITKAKMECLYIKTSKSHVTEATIKEWEVEFAGEPVHFNVIPSEDIRGSIVDFITHKNIDILAMVTYKRSVFVELFKPSLTHDFSHTLDVPILAFHFEE
jgi:nucleotide-binding universal stress UspA family protein